MRHSRIPVDILRKRRAELAKHMEKNSALIIPAHPEYLRNHDVHFPYRQDTNLFYLTGFEEPESVLVFRPGQTPETTLFVRPKDPLRETWDGFRFGPELAEKEFKVDQARLVTALSEQLPELLKAVDKIYYRLNYHLDFDQPLMAALQSVKASRGRSGMGLPAILDPSEVLGEMRVLKSSEEIEWLQKACDITVKAHINAMKFTRPGVSERQIQGVMHLTYMMGNSPREAYGDIVATGNNATTLHYVFNDQICKSGQMILIDAAAEFNYFSSDITRTFPVTGKFTQAQRDLYGRILEVQKDLIAAVKPGVPHKDLQEMTVKKLVDVMLDFKLLTAERDGSREQIIEKLTYKKYYPHGVSHFLGLDTHDAGLYLVNKESRKLESGMVMTIEPGVYIPATDESAPKDLRGIGIRIEDDILVTAGGNRNLTAQCPKEISELESLIGTGLQSDIFNS